MTNITPDSEKILTLGKPDTGFKDMRPQLSEPYIILDDDFNVPRLREQENAYMKSVGALVKPNPGINEVDCRVPVRDGTSIIVRFHGPRNPPATGGPIFVMLHSSGFCIGGLDNRIQDCRMFVEKWGFVVINLDYRLAPKFPFPTPAYDVFDAVKWVSILDLLTLSQRGV